MKIIAIGLLLAFSFTSLSLAQPAKKDKEPKAPVLKLVNRYGQTFDGKRFPQTTPRETLESIHKAILAEQIEYMMAHLADPAYVDEKVERYTQELNAPNRLASSLFVGRLGAFASIPDPKFLRGFDLPDKGLVLEKIRVNSAAAKAGFKDLDIILEVGLKVVPSLPSQFVGELGEFKENEHVDVKIVRQGRRMTIGNVILRKYVDPNRRVALRKIAEETLNLFFEDAARLAELRKFARQAEWRVEDNRAVGTLRQLGTYRQVFLRLEEDRWFLENRQKEH